jgi:hypothetical protein
MENPTRPVLVLMISWLCLILGVFVIFIIISSFSSNLNTQELVTNIFYAVLLLVAAFGLNKMRKYGLYSYTLFIILRAGLYLINIFTIGNPSDQYYGYFILSLPSVFLAILPIVAPFVAVLVYLWVIRRKFI